MRKSGLSVEGKKRVVTGHQLFRGASRVSCGSCPGGAPPQGEIGCFWGAV